LAIVVSGQSLSLIESNKSLNELLLAVLDSASVVLACRASPKQKADIVMMVRNRFPKKVTLAIGDGANDVSMILSAHIGIGILGKEGSQATRSSDFAIGQFQFIKPLLFLHGREAYRRNAMVVKYSFYKNIIICLPPFYFGF
jgi:P-type E1-E2 ATPase